MSVIDSGAALAAVSNFINKHFIRRTDAQSFAPGSGILLGNTESPFATPAQKFNLFQKTLEFQISGRLDPRISSGGAGQPHNPARWIPLNVLGEGGFGIASLWQYRGNGRPDDRKFIDTYVVLKTGKPGRGEQAMIDEGMLMNYLSAKKEEHWTNMIYVDGDFKKLYLEFCSGGDLAGELKRRALAHEKMIEEDVWRLLLCLAKGLFSMEFFDPGEASVLHFDIKPENILIDPQPVVHGCLQSNPLYKIGDFGIAKLKPLRPAKSHSYYAKSVGPRGTRRFHSPEMFSYAGLREDEGPARRKLDVETLEQWEAIYGLTPKLDVWGIGAIMWMIMTLERDPPTGRDESRYAGKDHRYKAGSSKYQPIPGECYGREIFFTNYSSDLIAVVEWCLMKLPELRCSSEELLSAAQEKVDQFNLKREADAAAAAPTTRTVPEPYYTSVGHQGRLLFAGGQPGRSLNLYITRLRDLLLAQGRTLAFYEERRERLNEQGRNDVMSRFLFKEGDERAFVSYMRHSGVDLMTTDGRDKDLALTYMLAFEESEPEIKRALIAYQRRTDVTYSRASRRQAVVRQLTYEATEQYRSYLLTEFHKRHPPEFMRENTDAQRQRVQRAYEDAQQLPDVPPSDAPRIREPRSFIIERWYEGMLAGASGHEGGDLEERLRREGRLRLSEEGSVALRMQIAWEEEQSRLERLAREEEEARSRSALRASDSDIFWG